MRPKGIVVRLGARAGDRNDEGAAAAADQTAPTLASPRISSQRADRADDKNLMPSMVARQQRGELTQPHQYQYASGPAGSSSAGAPIERVFEEAKRRAASSGDAQRQHSFDRDGLVLPRRVLPYQAADLQAPASMRDLQRELKFNQVRGRNVLEQKSELKKALEKLEANKRRKEAEQERLTRRTSLELRLEERAQRLAAKDEPPAEGKRTGDVLTN